MRRRRPKAQLKRPGRIKHTRIRPSQSNADGEIAAAPWARAASLGEYQPAITPIWPTRPQVPMPLETAAPFISILKRQVAIGPVIAEASVGGIQIFGFLMIFGIWSILVPKP